MQHPAQLYLFPSGESVTPARLNVHRLTHYTADINKEEHRDA